MLMQKRRSILRGLLGLGGLSAVAKASGDEKAEPRAAFGGGLQLFFAFRDTVINFNGSNGIGNHIGTVEGAITGTSITNFQFIPTSQTTITYDNRCLITDLDGDQIVFQVIGTGRFLAPPLSDPANKTLGSLMSLGGPLVATMTAIQASGKYAFLLGRKFPCKMAASNAANPSNGVLGNVYGEVYSDSVGVIASGLKRNSD
jgi:hypothetical protein